MEYLIMHGQQRFHSRLILQYIPHGHHGAFQNSVGASLNQVTVRTPLSFSPHLRDGRPYLGQIPNTATERVASQSGLLRLSDATQLELSRTGVYPVPGVQHVLAIVFRPAQSVLLIGAELDHLDTKTIRRPAIDDEKIYDLARLPLVLLHLGQRRSEHIGRGSRMHIPV